MEFLTSSSAMEQFGSPFCLRSMGDAIPADGVALFHRSTGVCHTNKREEEEGGEEGDCTQVNVNVN